MSKLATAVSILIAVVAGSGCFAAFNAAAQDYEGKGKSFRPYDGGPAPRPFEGRPGCYDVVTATGIGYPLGIFSKHSAIKAWKRQAWATYGREFKWSNAVDGVVECAPYKATIRCMAAARPCT